MSAIPGVINALCSIIRPLSHAVNIYIDVADIITEENISGLKVASVVSKSAILALDILGIIGNHSGKFSSKTLQNIKAAEGSVRMIDMPIQFAKTKQKLGTKVKTAQGVIHLIEKGMIGPSLSILRNICEANFYYEKNFFEAVKQNPEAKRPVWRGNENGDPILEGYKPIDPKECEMNMELFEKITACLNMKEISAEIGLLEGAYRIIILRTFEKILNRNRIQNNIPQNLQPIEPQAPQVEPPAPIDIDDLFNFKKLPNIPEEFHNDPVFSKYICPITQSPIRFIVMDPLTKDAENPTFYEHDAIRRWLAQKPRLPDQKPTSPATGKPLKVEALLLRPDLQYRIDNRLEFYENEVKNYILNLKEK